MSNNKIVILILAVVLLSSCSNTSAITKTAIEMELSENYDSSDPFIDERLFYASDDIDALDLDVSFQMKGEGGILEIADNETEETIWSDSWSGNTEETKFTVSLNALDKEREYVIRFTGTKIEYAKIVITFENSLVKEREKPQSLEFIQWSDICIVL